MPTLVRTTPPTTATTNRSILSRSAENERVTVQNYSTQSFSSFPLFFSNHFTTLLLLIIIVMLVASSAFDFCSESFCLALGIRQHNILILYFQPGFTWRGLLPQLHKYTVDFHDQHIDEKMILFMHSISLFQYSCLCYEVQRAILHEKKRVRKEDIGAAGREMISFILVNFYSSNCSTFSCIRYRHAICADNANQITIVLLECHNLLVLVIHALERLHRRSRRTSCFETAKLRLNKCS